jgi:hypothetical protein
LPREFFTPKIFKMAYKKINKRFQLTDNSVNCYGYRLLTEGLQLDKFKANPIGYLMHDRDKGVAVKWEDLKIEGDKLFGIPVINEDLFPTLAAQIEAGFYNAASVGHIIALEIDETEKMKLAGQTGVTVTKWFPRECSVVDIPGNYNSLGLSVLYDEKDNVLKDLTDKTKQKNINKMEVNKISAETLKLLNLSDNSSSTDFQAAISDLAAKAQKAETLQKELSDLKAASLSKEVEELLKRGLAAGKITNAVAEKLKSDYKGNPEGLKNLIDALPAQTKVTANLTADLPEKFKGKTYGDLYKLNLLEELKADYPEHFKALTEKQKK